MHAALRGLSRLGGSVDGVARLSIGSVCKWTSSSSPEITEEFLSRGLTVKHRVSGRWL